MRKQKALLPAFIAAALFAIVSGAAFGQNYWTGDGAKGLSVAVLVPEGRGLATAEAYLPTMVQGVLVGDFAKFSAMKVLDRQYLDKVIAEGESGVYTNEGGFVQLGTVANVQYILNGALQKTGQGFLLQLSVIEAASGASKAAYTGTVTAAELENLTGIKKASGDLLAQLGVTLTDAGKTSLLGVSTSSVQAETALAKGITAQRSGTVIEAMSYYYEAAKFDPSLAEAASRSSVLSADITGGNIGQNVRNDIEWRKAWVKTLDEAAAFFKEHPPFEIIYDPALTQGAVNYASETVGMSFKAKMISTIGFKIIADLAVGLEKTGRARVWGIGVDSIYRAIPNEYTFDAVLINENKETIGRASGRFRPSVRYDFSHDDTTVTFQNVDANKITDTLTVSIVSVNGMSPKTAGERGYMSISTEDFAAMGDTLFVVVWHFGGAIIAGYKGGGGKVVIPGKIGRWPVTSIREEAFSVKGLTSVVIPNSVTSIGYSAFRQNYLTSIVIPNSVTTIESRVFYSNRLTSVTLPANVGLGSYDALPCSRAYEENGKKAGTYTRPNADSTNWTFEPTLVSITIPSGTTSIGEGKFADRGADSVTIPNSVTSIGREAFARNSLTRVTIPNSVTSIGAGAFSGNKLTSVVIPNSVRSIGTGAFSNNGLTSAVIPNSVTSIGAGVFYRNALTSVTIPSSVTSIGKNAFANNKLTSVTLPASVKLDFNALPCQEAYEKNKRKAGTYTSSLDKKGKVTWKYQK